MKRQNLRTVSLIVVTFTYLLIGAAIFGYLESEHEVRQRENLELIELIVKRKYNISDDDFTVLTTTVIKSVPHKAGIQWKFSGAFYFATTVVTTIGYGHSTPATMAGRSFCMIYALIGIPLGLVMFQSIGERLNTFVGSALKYTKRCFKAKNPEVTQTNLVMVVSVLSTILMTSMAAVFAKYERWEYFDALYYCFITLTTIGFGDYVALQKESALQSKPEYVALSLIFILFGLSVVSSAVNLLVLKFLTLNTEDERRDEQLRYTANLNPILLEGDVITHPSGAIQYTGPQSEGQSKALQVARSETGASKISAGSNKSGEQALLGRGQPWSTSLNYRQPLKRYLAQGPVRGHSCSRENMCVYDQETIELGGQDEDEDEDEDEDGDEDDEDDDDDDDHDDEDEDGDDNGEEEDDRVNDYGENGDGDESHNHDCDVWQVDGHERGHFMLEPHCHDYSLQNSNIHSLCDSHLNGRESCETGTEESGEQDDDESTALAPKLTATAHWPSKHSRKLHPPANHLTNPLDSHHHQLNHYHKQHQQHQHSNHQHQQYRTHQPHPPGPHELDSLRLHHRHRHRQRHRHCRPVSHVQRTETERQQQAHRFQCQEAFHKHHHRHQEPQQFMTPEELQRSSIFISSPSNPNSHLLAIGTAPSQSLASRYTPSHQALHVSARLPSQMQSKVKQTRSRSRMGLEPSARNIHLSSCSCSWLSLSSNAVNQTADDCSQCLVLGAKGLMVRQQQRRQQRKQQRQQYLHQFHRDQQQQQASRTGSSTLERRLVGSSDTSFAARVIEQSHQMPQEREISSSIAGNCQQLVSSLNNSGNVSRTGYSSVAPQVTPDQYLQGQYASSLDSTKRPSLGQSVAASFAMTAAATAAAATTTTTTTTVTTTTTTKQAVAAVKGKRESLPTLYGPTSCKSENDHELCCKSFSFLAQSPTYIQTATTSKWPLTGHQDKLAGGSSGAGIISKRARTLPKLVCKCCCQHLECIEYALQSSKSTTCQGKQQAHECQQAKDSLFKVDKGGREGYKSRKKRPSFSGGIPIPESKSFGEGVNVVGSELGRGEIEVRGKIRGRGKRGSSSTKLKSGFSEWSLNLLKTKDRQTVAQSRDEGHTNELSDKAKRLDAILGADRGTEIFSVETSSAKLFKHEEKQTHSD